MSSSTNKDSEGSNIEDVLGVVLIIGAVALGFFGITTWLEGGGKNLPPGQVANFNEMILGAVMLGVAVLAVALGRRRTH